MSNTNIACASVRTRRVLWLERTGCIAASASRSGTAPRSTGTRRLRAGGRSEAQLLAGLRVAPADERGGGERHDRRKPDEAPGGREEDQGCEHDQ